MLSTFFLTTQYIIKVDFFLLFYNLFLMMSVKLRMDNKYFFWQYSGDAGDRPELL